MKANLHILFTLLLLLHCGMAKAQHSILPPLHVEGRQLVDCYGNTVNLHGVAVQPYAYWYGADAWGGKHDAQHVKPCLEYFHKEFEMMTDNAQGAYANVIRLHIEPAWCSEADWSHLNDCEYMNLTKVKTFLRTLFFPMAKDALDHGMYVVMRPPGVFPYYDTCVGDNYQKYLYDVFDIITSNDSIKKYSGQISLELGNEPINLWTAEGVGHASENALHDYFQPIVDKIRSNGYTGIIWVPGTHYQMNYWDFVNCPVSDDNMGYATHCYPGWYGYGDDKTVADAKGYIESVHNFWPIVDTNPIIVTEVDWSPATNKETGHYNENGDWVDGNYGTWGTARTSHWGNLYKAMLDHYGNISMTSLGAYLDGDYYRQTGIIRPAYESLGVTEGCGTAFFYWFKEWSEKYQRAPVMKRLYTADTRYNKYINPVLPGNFPVLSVKRVANDYYLLTKNGDSMMLMHSKDLVSWEYCENSAAQAQALGMKADGNNMVETPSGERWALVNKEDDLLGSMVMLEPVEMKNGTAVVGNDGEDVCANGSPYAKPNVGKTYQVVYPGTNDTFTSPFLAPQWTLEGDASKVSLTQTDGMLTLRTSADANENRLSQVVLGTSNAGNPMQSLYATIAIDASGLQNGDKAGLSLGDAKIAVVANGSSFAVETSNGEETNASAKATSKVFLRSEINPATKQCQFYFSTDNITYNAIGKYQSITSTPIYSLFATAADNEGGYAEVDWFSVEPEYSEEMFYKSNQLPRNTMQDITATGISCRNVQVLPGSEVALPLSASFANGKTENVAHRAVCSVEDKSVANVIGGKIIASKADGTTSATATFTDALGNEHSADFTISVSRFPLTEDGFNASLYKKGTFSSSMKSLTTGENGMGGWKYVEPEDFSAHKYLVLRLRRASSAKPVLRLYDSESSFDACYELKIGVQKEVKVELSKLQKTDGSMLDLSKIKMVGIASDGSSAIYISEAFLSDDGTNPAMSTGMLATPSCPASGTKGIYNLSGVKLSEPTRGVNIIDGKLILNQQ